MPVSLDRNLAWRTALLTLLFSWPLLVFGHPSHISDSASYLKGGAAAVEFVTGKFSAPILRDKGQSDTPSVDRSKNPVSSDPNEKPKAARSIVYSVAAYLLRWPGSDMTGLALLQIICAAFTVAVTANVAGATHRRFAALAVVIAFATPLATLAATICPDIFAGLAIAGIVLFAVGRQRMSASIKLLLAAIVALSVTTHASIPPIAIGMTLLSAAWWLICRKYHGSPTFADWAWLAAPTAVGMAVTIGAGFLAFGQVSVAAKRFPLALSRSVVDGPARWYLREQCVVPRYAVCEVFGTDIPAGTNEFLFDETGLKGRATPEQMDRIRAEETEIVVRAALEYPGAELYSIFSKTARQMGRFAPENTQFRELIAPDARGVPQVISIAAETPAVITLLANATLVAVAGSLAWLAINVRKLRRDELAAMLLLLGGLMGNAFVCVAFSALSDRYQERVIWLLPLFALVVGAGRGAAGHKTVTGAKGL